MAAEKLLEPKIIQREVLELTRHPGALLHVSTFSVRQFPTQTFEGYRLVLNTAASCDGELERIQSEARRKITRRLKNASIGSVEVEVEVVPQPTVTNAATVAPRTRRELDHDGDGEDLPDLVPSSHTPHGRELLGAGNLGQGNSSECAEGPTKPRRTSQPTASDQPRRKKRKASPASKPPERSTMHVLSLVSLVEQGAASFLVDCQDACRPLVWSFALEKLRPSKPYQSYETAETGFTQFANAAEADGWVARLLADCAGFLRAADDPCYKYDPRRKDFVTFIVSLLNGLFSIFGQECLKVLTSLAVGSSASDSPAFTYSRMRHWPKKDVLGYVRSADLSLTIQLLSQNTSPWRGLPREAEFDIVDSLVLDGMTCADVQLRLGLDPVSNPIHFDYMASAIMPSGNAFGFQAEGQTRLSDVDAMVTFVLQLMYALGGNDLDTWLFEAPLMRQDTSPAAKPWRTWSHHSLLKVQAPVWSSLSEAVQRCLSHGVIIQERGRYSLSGTFTHQLAHARLEARRWYFVFGLEYLCYLFPRSPPIRFTDQGRREAMLLWPYVHRQWERCSSVTLSAELTEYIAEAMLDAVAFCKTEKPMAIVKTFDMPIHVRIRYLHQRSVLYRASGDYQKSEDCIESAFALKADNPDVGCTYWHQRLQLSSAENYIIRKDFREAERLLLECRPHDKHLPMATSGVNISARLDLVHLKNTALARLDRYQANFNNAFETMTACLRAHGYSGANEISPSHMIRHLAELECELLRPGHAEERILAYLQGRSTAGLHSTSRGHRRLKHALAEAYIRQGKMTEAHTELVALRAAYCSLNRFNASDQLDHVRVEIGLARIAFSKQEWEEAQAHLDSGIQLVNTYRKTFRPRNYYHGLIIRFRALVLSKAGHKRVATNELRRALGSFDQTPQHFVAGLGTYVLQMIVEESRCMMLGHHGSA